MTAAVMRPAFRNGVHYCGETLQLLRLVDATRSLARTVPLETVPRTEVADAGHGLLDAAEQQGIDNLVWHLQGSMAVLGPKLTMSEHVERAVAALARDQGIEL